MAQVRREQAEVLFWTPKGNLVKLLARTGVCLDWISQRHRKRRASTGPWTLRVVNRITVLRKSPSSLDS